MQKDHLDERKLYPTVQNVSLVPFTTRPPPHTSPSQINESFCVLTKAYVSLSADDTHTRAHTYTDTHTGTHAHMFAKKNLTKRNITEDTL